jgi:hypothetical protein
MLDEAQELLTASHNLISEAAKRLSKEERQTEQWLEVGRQMMRLMYSLSLATRSHRAPSSSPQEGQSSPQLDSGEAD